MRNHCWVSCVLLVCGWTLAGRADDWPQWRGADRTGCSKEKGLLKQWPKDGPKLLWERKDIGGGYSTPAVVGDRLYVMADREGKEYVLALSVRDGKEVWARSIGKVGRNEGPQYPGARSTPTIESVRIYALGSDGDLACLEKADGKVIWTKNLKKDFAGAPGAWAYSESVLIDGDKLICTPGGKEAVLVALKKSDGSTIWKCAIPDGDKAGYASPIVMTVGGVRQYIQFLGKGLVGVDADTGKLLWKYEKTKDDAANIPTPVSHEDCVFTSTSRKGSGLNRVKVRDGSVTSEEVYFNRIKLSSIGGVVRVGDSVYGTDERGELVCMHFQTGEEKWRHESVKHASLCYADRMLYVRGHGGTGFGPSEPAFVTLVEATPEGYKECGRFQQPDHGRMPAWPHPIVANGRLYLRDGQVLLCYDVKAPK